MTKKSKHTFTRVNSLDKLKQMCNGVTKEFFIQLNFGIRSSKNISYNKDTDTFYILNEIDGTEQELNSQTIMDEEYTNIGKAITLGSFYAYKMNITIMENKSLKVGDKVKWYDPEIEFRDLNVIWTISKIYGDLNDEDTIILITNEYGSEAEVSQNEIKKIN